MTARREQLSIFDPVPAAGVDPADAEWRQGPIGSWPLAEVEDPVTDALHKAARAAWIRWQEGGADADGGPDHCAYADL